MRSISPTSLVRLSLIALVAGVAASAGCSSSNDSDDRRPARVIRSDAEREDYRGHGRFTNPHDND